MVINSLRMYKTKMCSCKIYFLTMCYLLAFTSAQNYTKTKQKVNELRKKHNILFGTATSAYQVEGAWNEPGTTESIWDRFTHEYPEYIADKSTGDISCDSYHNIERDIGMLKYLGVHYYRFSISWSRIAPIPMSKVPNQDGLRYYHNLIDTLKANNIIPLVTLNHFDLPQNIQDFGGWTNEISIDYFENYAQIVFDNFADKVNYWVTFNEPNNLCQQHPDDELWPPLVSHMGIFDYLCVRNLLLAHARVYHLYKNKYDTKRKGMMGLSLTFNWFESKSNSPEDLEAVERVRTMVHGIYADPIYSTNGDFPELLKDVVANKSRQQGFRKSRLPEFSTAEIEYMRNTYDFMGINYYTAAKIDRISIKSNPVPSFKDDLGISSTIFDESWTPTPISWLRSYPQGLRKSLVYIKNTYNNPKVMILENGCAHTDDSLDNYDCVEYFTKHLDAVYDAVVYDGCKVQAYTAWCLMDNFEWDAGYTTRFGLFYTDFKNATRPTHPKATARLFKEILSETEGSKNLHWPTNEDELDFENTSGSENSKCINIMILSLSMGFSVIFLILTY